MNDLPLVNLQVFESNDDRGLSIPMGDRLGRYLGRLRDCHAATVGIGAVRGNHCHLRRKEVLLIRYRSEWLLAWDAGAGTAIQSRTVAGDGLAVVEIGPGASHAVVNTGDAELVLVSLSNGTYDAASGETMHRVVWPA